MPTLSDLLAVLDRAYPRRLAEPWDTGIGLTCGDPATTVSSVLLAVDVDAAVVGEAEELGADLLLTHHPLLFRPVQSVATTTPKGALLHRLIRAGIAHVAAHTNADRAVDGVNDALAQMFGLQNVRPLVPAPAAPLDKIVTFVPVADAARLIEALAAAGAGRIGDYTEAAFILDGVGQFRPGPGATRPSAASERTGAGAGDEDRDGRRTGPAGRRGGRDSARAHPYEEPAFDLVELVSPDEPGAGLGRSVRLPTPMSLAGFVEHVAARLPATAAGVRAGGDPQRLISTSRCAAEPATASSMRRPRPVPTST